MTNEQTIESIMKSARARITSENATHVTVARMPAEEVAALLDEIERLKAKLAKPAPGEWIEWKGGECPLADGVKHQVRFRGDSLSRVRDDAASWWSWRHDCEDFDIVAYRVLP